MNLMFVVAFYEGPGTVGPFESEAAADAWAARYLTEVQKIDPTKYVTWRIESVARPENLQWW